MSEFNLSDKIWDSLKVKLDDKMIYVSDVKSFISLLKKEFKKREFMEEYEEGNSFEDFINKLSGDMLI